MSKKILAYVLCFCIMITCSACGPRIPIERLFGFNTEDSDEEYDFDNYENGFFTKDAYYNKCANLMFECPKSDGFKFYEKDSSDFKETGFCLKEALCISDNVSVLFGYKMTSDDNLSLDGAVKEIKNDVESSIYYVNTIVGSDKGEKEKLAGKEYRRLEVDRVGDIYGKNKDEKSKAYMYITKFKDTCFVIEVAGKESDVDDFKLDKYISKLNLSRNELTEKEKEGNSYRGEEYESKDHKSSDSRSDSGSDSGDSSIDDYKEKRAQRESDPAVDNTGAYTAGRKDGDNYVNDCLKIRYDKPARATIEKDDISTLKEQYTVLSSDKTAGISIQSGLFLSFNTMDDFVKEYEEANKKESSNFVLLSSDKTEEFLGKTWRVLEITDITKNNVKIRAKVYVRLIGTHAFRIDISHSENADHVAEQLKAGFSTMD